MEPTLEIIREAFIRNPTKEQILKEFDQFFNIQKEIDKELRFLLEVAGDKRSEFESPYFLRIYLRSLFMCMEATINSLKAVIAVCLKDRDQLEGNKILRLFHLNKKAKVDRSTPLEDNFNETMKMFSLLLSQYGLTDIQLRFNRGKADKRNSITHPKSLIDLKIEPKDVESASDYIDEIREKIIDRVGELITHLKHEIHQERQRK